MGCTSSKAQRERESALATAAAAAAKQREAAATAAVLPTDAGMPRVESKVMRAASLYDQRDEAAKAPPALVAVDTAAVGVRSRALLDGFEEKERAARRVEELRSVEKKDVRCESAAFKKMLGDYEEKDAKVAAEPKLEKTFVQREKESVARVAAIERAAELDVVVPSIHS
jgi:hypothetical protein